MKKTVCVLAALIVLFASCAQAESAGSGPLYTLDIKRDGTSLVFSGPDFPGLAVTLSESDAEAVPPFVTELLLSFGPDRPAELIRRFFAALDAWTGMHPENAEETGVYAGDAFLKARTRKRFEASAEELLNFEALVYPADPFFRRLYEMPAVEGERLTGAVYEDGKYYSVDLMNGEDCVLSVSADLSAPDEVYLVCGFSSGTACYYIEFSAVTDGSGTISSASLYRGEEAFFSPRQQTLCQTLQAVFSQEGEKQEFSGTFDSILLDAPVRFEGTVTDCSRVSVPEGKIGISLSRLLEYASLWLQFNPELKLTDLIRLIPNPV